MENQSPESDTKSTPDQIKKSTRMVKGSRCNVEEVEICVVRPAFSVALLL